MWFSSYYAHAHIIMPNAGSKYKETTCAMAGAGASMEVSEGSPVVASVETVVPSPLNMTQLRERRERRKLRCKKLGKKLEILDRQIKKCAEAEVGLEEMKSGYSAYIKEDLLKRKFVKTWQELCDLQHKSDRIVVEDTESVSYEGTPYPEINRRIVQRIQKDEFPDYIDIVHLLDRCNTKYSLGIVAEERGMLARKVFKDIGKILKQRRHRDFIATFGSHLTDSFTAVEDPAEKDEDLLKELQLSLREGERKMEVVVEEFVVKQEQEYGTQRTQEGDSCSANEQEDEEEGEPQDNREDRLQEETKDGPRDEREDEQEEKDDEDGLINVVDSGSEGDTQLPHVTKRDDPATDAARVEVTADSTTAGVASPVALVSSTHPKQEDEQPGPSGLTCRSLSHISSNCEVVCLDDDDDVIILTD